MSIDRRVAAAGRPAGRSTRAVAYAAAVTAVLAAVVVTWRLVDDADDVDHVDADHAADVAVPSTTTPTTTPTTMTTPTTPAATPAAPPVESELPWPDPPGDHEPHVLRSPGNGPLVADAGGLGLLYVNSIGRVTLLDLTSGDRTEVEVSAERSEDAIALEAGGFRSLVRRMNVELAGPGAAVLRLHRPTLLGGGGRLDPGLHLCLTVSCVAAGRHEGLVADDVPPDATSVALEPLDASGVIDRPDIAALLGADVPVRGRFRIVETPDGTARIPEPLGGSVWLVRPAGTAPARADV